MKEIRFSECLARGRLLRLFALLTCYSTNPADAWGSVTFPQRSTRGCCINLQDPQTGCQVAIVGCFHGSETSASDVYTVLTDAPTDVVVLELCANRFASMRQEVSLKSRNWFQRFLRMVQKTSQERGIATASVAALLGSVSGLQTALSGLSPGLEFKTALRYATSHDKDIVLADQDVDDLLSKLANIASLSKEMWGDLLARRQWKGSLFSEQTKVLSVALCGSRELAQSVTFPSFLIRSHAAVLELLRLSVPPLALLQFMNIAALQFLGETSPTPADASAAWLPILANVVFLSSGIVSLILPATKIILDDRDEQLASGVQAACRVAGPNGRVVVVLGFLHVNGVAEKIVKRACHTE